MRQKGGSSFVVTIGADDDPEICNLLTYIYFVINKTSYDSKTLGLYRNDNLTIFKTTSGCELEKIKKTHTEDIQRYSKS